MLMEKMSLAQTVRKGSSGRAGTYASRFTPRRLHPPGGAGAKGPWADTGPVSGHGRRGSVASLST